MSGFGGYRNKADYLAWHRKNWRRLNGWDESRINDEPEPRTDRSDDYHRIIDLVNQEPHLSGPQIADRLGLESKHVIHRTLVARKTKLSEIKSEALEFWKDAA